MPTSEPAPPTERVAVLTSSFPKDSGDASGHFVLSEVKQLVREGHDVSVLVPYPTRLGGELLGNARIVQLPGGGLFGWPGTLPRLKANPLRILALPGWVIAARRQLQLQRYDRVIAHWLLPCAWPAASAFPGPLEITVHGSDLALLRRLPHAISRRIFRELLGAGGSARLPHQSTSFRCVSRALSAELFELGRRLGVSELLPAERVTVKACALDLSGVPERDEARRLLGLAPDAFHALSVGRLIESKRVDRALEHAPVPDNTQWTVVGDGPLLPELRARFPRVRFVGAVPRPMALLWMRAADLVVCASEREGSPTAIREARALGTEVWTSAVGDVLDWAAEDPGIRVLSALG